VTAHRALPYFLPATLIAGLIVFNIGGILLVGPYAWDDGAITLAYARTLSEQGRFALTAASEIVEGTSSVLWTTLLALVHIILRPGFEGFILASQALSLACLLAMLALLYRPLGSAVPSVPSRLLILGLFGLIPLFTAESLNGMEMTMAALLLTAFLLVHESRSYWAFLVVPLLLLVRFEFLFYLILSLVVHSLIDRDSRRFSIALTVSTATWLMLFTTIRLAVFGDYLPNTVRAKMNPPYSALEAGLLGRFFNDLSGLWEFLRVEAVLITVVCGLLVAVHRRRTDSDRIPLAVVVLFSFGLFAALAGPNWGYTGRMFVASLPVALLAIVGLIERSGAEHGMRVFRPGARNLRVGQAVAPVLIISALLGTHLVNGGLLLGNIKTILSGGHYRGLLPARVDLVVEKLLSDDETPYEDWYGVTPANYRITGAAVDAARQLLGLETIRFMTPDVGGVGLGFESIEIIDTAMLTNSHLARHGYAEFERYLVRTEPDVIETHDGWSEITGIYSSKFFESNYVPLVIDNNLCQ